MKRTSGKKNIGNTSFYIEKHHMDIMFHVIKINEKVITLKAIIINDDLIF